MGLNVRVARKVVIAIYWIMKDPITLLVELQQGAVVSQLQDVDYFGCLSVMECV